MKNKKIKLIPGWMNEGDMYLGKGNIYEILEIWKDQIDERCNISADYLIGHSLGCNWALKNWTSNKKMRLILVNPLLPKRSLLTWFLRWRRFRREEKSPLKKKTVKETEARLFGIKKCFTLLRYDFDEIIKNIPKENISIICGKKDTFYCDERFRQYVRSKNIRLIEIGDAGHDWNEGFDREIEKMIS